jgi:hypothetical protein
MLKILSTIADNTKLGWVVSCASLTSYDDVKENSSLEIFRDSNRMIKSHIDYDITTDDLFEKNFLGTLGSCTPSNKLSQTSVDVLIEEISNQQCH